jgi:hypothetical protein
MTSDLTPPNAPNLPEPGTQLIPEPEAAPTLALGRADGPTAAFPPPYTPTDVLTPPEASPRVRWAGIVWGALFAAIAAVMLWTLTDATRRGAIHDWMLTLSPSTVTPGAVVGFSLLALGILLLVGGGVALLRRAQLRAALDR